MKNINRIIKEEYKKLEASGKEEEMFEFFENIHEEKYTIGLINLSHRVLTNWEDKNLLLNPKEKKDEKWRKFDLSSIVWLKIIQELRAFNIPLVVIETIKEQICYQFDFKNNDEERQFFRDLITMMDEDDDIEEDAFNKAAEIISLKLIDFLVLEAAGFQTQISLLFKSDGAIMVYRESLHNEFIKNEEYLDFVRDHHLVISISKIIGEILSIIPENELIDSYQFLTEDEMKILRAIREEKNIKSLEVKIRKKKKVDLIKVGKEEKVDLKSRLMDLIAKNGYHDIKLSTENGNIVRCENVRKTK